MAERRRWRLAGSVRVRLTAAVTVLFAAALTVASVVFVGHVRRALVADTQARDQQAVDGVRARIVRDGQVPTSLLPPLDRPQVQLQLVAPDGQVVAATPGADGVMVFGAGAPAPIGPAVGPFVTAAVPNDPAPGGPEPVSEVLPAAALANPPVGGVDYAVTQVPLPPGLGGLTVVATSPLSEVRTSVDTLQRTLVVAVPSLVLLIGATAWLLTGRALRPVDAITGRVEAISGSSLHERVPVPASHDEVAHLARTMNAMLDRLESSDRRQKQFVSDASHELRSPVATIRTQLEVALLHPQDTDWAAVARDVLAEDERLDRIVGDLLTLARLAEAPDLIDAVEVDLGTVVAEEAARARRVPVEVRGAEPVRVLGRREELERLVGHLLDNACRHARGRVVVTWHQVEDAVVLTVDDDGPGVPPEQRADVFERFGRGDEGRARDRGGAGLGLAVVRRIATRHGGDVSVAEAPEGGARFIVRLPAVAPSPPA